MVAIEGKPVERNQTMICKARGSIAKMKTPERFKEEALTDYAVRLSSIYSKYYNIEVRKDKGQIFTPKEVATFMAKLVNIEQQQIRVLDPGAGTGILVAALCDRIKSINKGKDLKIVIHAYENDQNLVPLLKAVLKECITEMNSFGFSMEYTIYEQDFILHNANNISKEHKYYDIVISNPPYYKINKISPHSIAMKELIYGQPNMYTLFMALATNLLRDKGEGVFIIPRSFCSGLYYKKFRKWFLNNTVIDRIHIFESRKDIFTSDKVLQENIILKFTKGKSKTKTEIGISISKDKSFKDIKNLRMKSKYIFYSKNGDVFIRIPSSSFDKEIIDTIDKWPNTLNDIGLEISTGPVVPFRAKRYLREKFNKPNEVPLLWMHNIQGFNVIWPYRKNGKEESILLNEESKSMLLPVKNYVLLKRFSSKEQKRRLHAGVMLKEKFEEYKYIGIENHINYIHRPTGMLSKSEAFGIAALLNTAIIDRYFRILNGSTQVNVTDIRSMPFPSIDQIRKIGEVVLKQIPSIGYELDIIVAKILGWNPKLIKRLYGAE